MQKISKHTYPELVSVYSKVTEYEVNIQMSIAFLYIINEQLAMKYKTWYLSILTEWRKKHLGIDLTKYVLYLLEENYKTLMYKM